MAEPHDLNALDWRHALPLLAATSVTLREPALDDAAALTDLLSVPDATNFGIEGPLTLVSVLAFIDRAARQRRAGTAFVFCITAPASRRVIGLARVRELNASFEAAEWEMTLAPSARGTTAFVDAARLLGSFAFDVVGAHRLEARVPALAGRANGALRKLGAVEEGLLRRSLRQRDGYADQVLWSILKEDWGERRVSTSPRVH